MQVGHTGRLLNGIACDSLPGGSATALRLHNLGFVPGTEIEVLRRAPFGGPIEVEIRGYRICLRQDDLASMKVSLEGSGETCKRALVSRIAGDEPVGLSAGSAQSPAS